jgi:geranylgeranylglycerol-phosphate geranylgeranyltransferase
MLGYVQLLRPRNCAMAALSVLIVALMASTLEPDALLSGPMLLACAVVVLFTGAGNALNDYVDRETDRVNHPKRPIPRGRASSKGALAFSGALFCLAILLSLWLDMYCIAVVLVNLVVMLGYEYKGKASGLGGNLMISWLTSSLFLFGGLAIRADYPSIMEPVLVLLPLSLFATLGREIAKDIQDVRGDVNRRTLPRVLGVRRARYAADAAFVVAVVLSPLPFLFGHLGWTYLLIVLVADATFINAVRVLGRRPRKAQESAKLAMVVALAAFLLGGAL